jgi:hypothetical protein
VTQGIVWFKSESAMPGKGKKNPQYFTSLRRKGGTSESQLFVFMVNG